MSVHIFDRRESFIEARNDLATATTLGLAPSERTLAVQLLAGTFVDTFSSALDGDEADMLSWIGRMCDTYADQPAVTKFLNGACTSLEMFLAQSGVSERERGALRQLDPKIRAVAQRTRSTPPPAAEQMDETDALINQFVWRLERADTITAEHSRAVAAWCARIARRLTLSDGDVAFASRCGMIHDVGKITTPPQVLNAPRKLTQAERDIMQRHTIKGCELIAVDPVTLDVFQAAVRSHHERLDGSGYPDGRALDEIPLVTRIVSVADSFNAMIGRRPYRSAMPISVALEELERNRGTQFDPDIVDAMHAVVGSW